MTWIPRTGEGAYASLAVGSLSPNGSSCERKTLGEDSEFFKIKIGRNVLVPVLTRRHI